MIVLNVYTQPIFFFFKFKDFVLLGIKDLGDIALYLMVEFGVYWRKFYKASIKIGSLLETPKYMGTDKLHIRL